MMDPTRPPELDELVALLRSATPPASVLQEARASVVSGGLAGPPPAGTVGLAARIGWLMMMALAASAVQHDAPPRAGVRAMDGASFAKEQQQLSSQDDAIDVAAAIAPPAVSSSAIAPSAEVPSSVVRAPHPIAEAPIAEARRSDARAQRPVRESAAGPSRTVTEARAPIPPRTDAHLATTSEAREDAAKQNGDPIVTAPVDAAPSETLAEALRAYAGERWAEAAVGFQRVVDGTSDDAPARVAQADFFLAKCLYHLELYHASAAAFDEVTRRGREHPYFDESLRWLAMLAERLPDPSGVIESVGRYDEAALAALDTAETREHYHHLLYLLGRARYSERRLDEAIELFAELPDDTRWALEARFFEGVSHVRAHRAGPALAAFRRAIEAVESGRTGGHDDPSRLYDLAWMSVARLYYSLAMQRPSADDEHASELLTLAVAAWRRVPLRSEYWLDSFFEETWALYVARQYGRALGHVHALESPYFRDRADPEALVIRAMIFFEHCQWDAVDQALVRFHRRFDSVLVDAQRADRMASSNEDAFRMLVAVRAGRSRVSPRVAPALRAAFADRDLERSFASVRSIEREQRRLAATGAPILETTLHARVAGDLSVLRSLAVEHTGELARARVHRFVESLEERMTQMDTVELELATVRREELQHPNRNPMGPADGGRIVAVQGDQIWIWDGEWWRDELPFYVQEIQSRCAR